MQSLQNDLNTLCAELRSEKIPTRNKAADRLDNILMVSKNEVISLFLDDSHDVSGTDVFNSAIEATLKHAAKIEDSREAKNLQTLRNKCFVYTNIITKLIDYSLEDGNNFLSKSSIFNAFTEGFSIRSVVVNFGLLFLDLIERGIYRSPMHVRELKINEYSRILSYLFEVNVGNDEVLRFTILRVINKTIELAAENVQISSDLIDYLPEVLSYANSAKNDNRKADVIKLFYLFISQLSIDYHQTICNSLQEQLPLLLNSFYNVEMKPETKDIFFRSTYLSLRALYPYINDKETKTIVVQLPDGWSSRLFIRIKTIIEMEIKKRSLSYARLNQGVNQKFFKSFTEMAACCIYLMRWDSNCGNSTSNKNSSSNDDDDQPGSSKVTKPSDSVEEFLALIQPQQQGPVNENWLAVFTELVSSYRDIVNSTNISHILQSSVRYLAASPNANSFLSCRRILTTVLLCEKHMIQARLISSDYCQPAWIKLIKILIADTSVESEIIKEKEALLQGLVNHGKLSSELCSSLFHAYFNSVTMKRNECLKTVRTILINADKCEINKTSELISKLITWIYEKGEAFNAKTIIHNIQPLDPELIADISSLASINFLNERTSHGDFVDQQAASDNSRMLLYKHNRKLVCLEEHAEILKLEKLNTRNLQELDKDKQNCLFQSNYEAVMRALNFETSQQFNFSEILSDLNSLLKISLVMKSYLEYDVYSAENFRQCPLIKRVGFFLNHLEFQMKSVAPLSMDRSNQMEILQLLEMIFKVFTKNPVLLQYIEQQTLTETINFLDSVLKHSVNQKRRSDFEDWSSVVSLCLRNLAHLCAFATHNQRCIENIRNFNFDFKNDLNIFLDIVKILCATSVVSIDSSEWFVELLKDAFKSFYLNTDFVHRITLLMPAIFNYVQQFEDDLHNMLIALYSLLKIAYKKSYSNSLTSSLLHCVRQIIRNNSNFYRHKDFRNICISAVKFLTFPSLEIQFAAIKTLTAFMDTACMRIEIDYWEDYYDFCEALYSNINFKDLSTSSSDMEENSKSITVQVLVSLFAFSSYHKETALKELVYFCAKHKIRDDFILMKQIAGFYGRELKELTDPFVSSLVHYWASREYPISKFPYFLFCREMDDFFTDNMAEITTIILLYGKPDDLKFFRKYGQKQQLLEMALPHIHAFFILNDSYSPEMMPPEFSICIARAKQNLSELKTNLPECGDVMLAHWRTLLSVISFLKDETHYQGLFKHPVFYQQKAWFQANVQTLQACLNLYINNDVNAENTRSCLKSTLLKRSNVLIKVFGELKRDCVACAFSNEKAKYFHMFCMLADLVIDSFAAMSKNELVRLRSSIHYFVIDIASFILQYIKSDAVADTIRGAIIFLHHIVMKLMSSQLRGCSSEAIIFCTSDICLALVKEMEQNSMHADFQRIALDLLKLLVECNQEKGPLSAALLDILPASDEFLAFKESEHSENGMAVDLRNSFKTFLSSKNQGASGFKALQRDVSRNKYQLAGLDETIFAAVKQLIEYARNAGSVELAMEASKCLGEIGPVKIKGRSYFFEADVDFYERDSENEVIQAFAVCVTNSLEGIIFTFNIKTYRAMHDVIQQVVNSIYGPRIKDKFDYLKVFAGPSSHANYLNEFSSAPDFDFIEILESTASIENYDQWICEFASKVYAQCGWSSFQELSSQNVHFADASFESLMKLWISDKGKSLERLIAVLEFFFDAVYEAITLGTASQPIYKDKRVVKKLLNICESIRISQNFNFPINFLYVAKACNYCQAYFMSIMYLELWALNMRDKEQKKSHEIKSNATFQEVALKAYHSIGCTDGISGFLNPMKSRLEYLSLNNNWSDVVLEATLKGDPIEDQLYTSILKRNGMLCLAGLQNKGSEQSKAKMDYEVCWRLCQWDVEVDGHSKVNNLNDMENEYEKHHFNALKCLYNREENNTLAALQNARLCIVSILKEISTECLQSIYKYVSWLSCLQQIEDLCQLQFPSNTPINELFEKWSDEKNLEFGNFQCKEQLLSHQVAVFQTSGIRAKRKIKEYFKNDPVEMCLLHSIAECKKAGEINLAKRNIALLRNMNPTNALIKINVLLEDADVCIKSGEFAIASSILGYIMKNKELNCISKTSALRMQGKYLLETNSDAFESVRKKYFSGALDALNDYGSQEKAREIEKSQGFFNASSLDRFISENQKNICKVIAKYANREYTQLNTYMNSDEYHQRLNIIEKNRKAAESVGRQNSDRDKNIGAVFLKRNANSDEKEIRAYETRRTENLCIALEYYIKFCVIDETASEPTIYRIIALWFSNKQNEKLQAKIQENIDTFPSYKFICALNQITARLNSKNQAFIKVLKTILIRCAQEHPHQTLYKLFALVLAFNDGTKASTNDRVEIAREIIFKARTKTNAAAIKQYEAMFPALIDFANATIETSSSKSQSIVVSDSLKRLRNLNAIQCPTIDLPVQASAQYEITSIVKWDDHASLVGGINAPKKLHCLCSDGIKRPQLLKGKDDLRQDAVMQQVFALINSILSSDPEAQKRGLLLRTYKVTPLSMRTGILEWCADTVPLGAYLIEAHKRYRPKDYEVKKCRILTHEHLKASDEKRLQVFLHLCAKIKPVMHYFLLEKFLVSGIWFERRLAYTSSVATTSIVGYILGIGDRHAQNILIDEKTAEVVHIDFGIAFEQGKVMPTPETVPFRLTRDMVAPFGICETNGVFKKSCEVTMSILRNNLSVITTILEVLLYDPLYMWKVIQQKNANESPCSSTEETNLTAQRALLSVHNKLEGKQFGILGTSNVEVQVQRLINEAVAPRNLCLLFSGWDAFM